MTQRQICRQIGVSPALVTSWAKGKQTPSIEQLTALRELVRVTAAVRLTW
jgi:transcriptional regulator with XRE-family HTH domain